MCGTLSAAAHSKQAAASSEGLKNVNGEISDCEKKFMKHSDPVVPQERKVIRGECLDKEHCQIAF